MQSQDASLEGGQYMRRGTYLMGGELSGGEVSGDHLSGGELEGGKKHKKHATHKYKHGASGLNKEEMKKFKKAHKRKSGSPVVKLTQEGVLGIRQAISDYKMGELDGAAEEVSMASTKEHKAQKMAESEGMKKTAKLAKQTVEKMDMTESKIRSNKPATAPLSNTSASAKLTHASAVKDVTGIVIGHSKKAKAARSAHREKHGKPRSPRKSPKSPKGMKKDGSPRKVGHNPWIAHVKKYRATHDVEGMSVGDVATAARASYKK